MKNRPLPRPLTGTVSRTCRRIQGGWQNASVRGLNLSCERRRVENDESFDFTALRITRLLVTTRNEMSQEEEEEKTKKKKRRKVFPWCYVFLPIRYFDFLHLVYGIIMVSTLRRKCVLWIRCLSFHSLHFSLYRNKMQKIAFNILLKIICFYAVIEIL